jgi:ribosomal protein S18 acetylase RimI-like enzyme
MVATRIFRSYNRPTASESRERAIGRSGFIVSATARAAMLTVMAAATTRHARPDDERALRTIDHLTWSPLASPTPAPAPERPFFRPGVDPQDVLVAELVDGGALAGYVHLGPALPLESAAHVLEIKGLAVDPAHQGQGFGRLLLEAAAAEARGRGARRLTLRVLSPNAAARALYSAAGFAVEGTLREQFRLEDAYVDDVLMALDLS